MVDEQFAPLSDKIAAAIKQLTPQPITFLVNTHVHGDHTGGNEIFIVLSSIRTWIARTSHCGLAYELAHVSRAGRRE
jgi:glyoxylase-like metal-dependent hydrolase (beta-lactamase superfamily II)